MPHTQQEDFDFNAFFDQILKAFSAKDVTKDEIQKLADLRSLLNPCVPAVTMAATDFDIYDAISVFGLKYKYRLPKPGESLKWCIEDNSGTKNFPMSEGMQLVFENYSINFSRFSKAECRTALDLMLNECLTVMKGNHLPVSACPQGTSTHDMKWDDIKVFGEVSFTHTTACPTNGKPVKDFLGTIIKGRVNSIGRVIPGSHPSRFQSFLLIVEAKTTENPNKVVPELVVYLGAIHQSRRRQHRHNCTVYGVASDGFSFIFVTITHEGELKESKRFEITEGHMQLVLGCIKHMIEMSASIILEPKFDDVGCELTKEVCDSEMDVDDSDYVYPQREEPDSE